MAHINVRADDRGATLPDADSAILRVITLQLWSKLWDFEGSSFGRTIEERQKIDAAIRAKDRSAFKAKQRRGYWQVDLA